MTTINERLAEMRAREQAATSGPWEVRPNGDMPWIVREGTEAWLAMAAREPGALPKTVNATFIAHARTDLPALLAAIEAVVAVIDDLMAERNQMYIARDAAEEYETQGYYQGRGDALNDARGLIHQAITDALGVTP